MPETLMSGGNLLTRAADVGHRSAMVYRGFILATAYVGADRKLWGCILAHGFIDTFGIIDAFFGWSS